MQPKQLKIIQTVVFPTSQSDVISAKVRAASTWSNKTRLIEHPPSRLLSEQTDCSCSTVHIYDNTLTQNVVMLKMFQNLSFPFSAFGF